MNSKSTSARRSRRRDAVSERATQVLGPDWDGRSFVRCGQSFIVVETEPYVRRDGQIVTLRHLLTDCRTCGAEFRTTCGPMALLDDSRYIARRCPDCRAKRAARAKRPKCPTCGRRLPEGRG